MTAKLGSLGAKWVRGSMQICTYVLVDIDGRFLQHWFCGILAMHLRACVCA